MTKLNRASWPENTVVKVQPFTGKTFIGNVEVIYDPIDRVYSPLEKRSIRSRGYTEYDLREI
jgi:hypothetical protein